MLNLNSGDNSILLLITAGFVGYFGTLAHSLPRKMMNLIMYLFSYSITSRSEDSKFVGVYWGVRQFTKNSKILNHLDTPVYAFDTTFSGNMMCDVKEFRDLLYPGEEKDISYRVESPYESKTFYDIGFYRPFPEGTRYVRIGKFTLMKINITNKIRENSGGSPLHTLISRTMSINIVGLNAKKYRDSIENFELLIKPKKDEIVNKNMKNPRSSLFITSSFKFTGDKTIMCSRDLDTIFIDNKEEFISNMKYLLSNTYRQKILNMGHNYKVNILLSGNPGTGKTSLIKAIATHYTTSGHLTMVTANDLYTGITSDALSTVAGYHRFSEKFDHVVVLEEIDTLCKSRKDRNSDEIGVSNGVVLNNPLNELLNILDGSKTPVDSFTISTTNHIEKLDPALVRRFDLIVNVGDISKKTAKEMCRFYDVDEKYIDERYSNVDTINPSKLSRELLKESIGESKVVGKFK